MKVLASGVSGFIGSTLVPLLERRGHTVTRLVRRTPRAHAAELQWNPAAGSVVPEKLGGFDAAIHLGGENIAALRWTRAKMERIRSSRVDSTRLLAEGLAKSGAPPRVLLAASAIGYYGSRGNEVLREGSPPGSGFLAEVGQAWEQAAEPARLAGIRVVNLRTGIVLGRSGGALRQMLPAFRAGIGGVIGNGSQYMSWIALEDLAAAIVHLLENGSVSGPVNCVSPTPVTNREFTKALGRILERPTILPLPTWGIRFVMGAMADETLLASTRVEPEKLVASGFRFRFPTIGDALQRAVGSP